MSVIKILTFENVFLDFLWRLLVALPCSFFTFVSADVHLTAAPSSVFVACGRLAVFMLLFISSGKNYLECQWFLMNELIEYMYKITNFLTDLNKKSFLVSWLQSWPISEFDRSFPPTSPASNDKWTALFIIAVVHGQELKLILLTKFWLCNQFIVSHIYIYNTN